MKRNVNFVPVFSTGESHAVGTDVMKARYPPICLLLVCDIDWQLRVLLVQVLSGHSSPLSAQLRCAGCFLSFGRGESEKVSVRHRGSIIAALSLQKKAMSLASIIHLLHRHASIISLVHQQLLRREGAGLNLDRYGPLRQNLFPVVDCLEA